MGKTIDLNRGLGIGYLCGFVEFGSVHSRVV